MRNRVPFVFITLIIFSCTEGSKEVSKEVYDTIVIGGGLMGSSTAWHLSNHDGPVLLLEKQDSIYDQGSSYGEARIARSSNRGNDIWSYLHNNSLAETEKLIAYLQDSEPDQSYSMDDLYTTTPVTYVGRVTIYEKLLASLIRQKVEYEIATNPAEGKSKFDVNLPDSVLIQREYNALSGTLNPHQLINYLHKAVVRKGNTIQYNTEVLEVAFNENSDLYEIKTKDGKTGEIGLFHSQNVVSAAGPYTGKLLHKVAPYFDTLINPQRVFLAFMKIKAEQYKSLGNNEKEKLKSFYPVINSSKGTRDGSFFSMIEYFDEKDIPVIKIGGHFQRTDINNLDSVWSKELAKSEIEWSLNNTSDYLKLLNLPVTKDEIEFMGGYSCVYSLTKNEVPLVTPILNEDGTPNEKFVVLGGMSGVGAKGAMTYGLIASDILNKIDSNDSLYNIVKEELGFNRLKRN